MIDFETHMVTIMRGDPADATAVLVTLQNREAQSEVAGGNLEQAYGLGERGHDALDGRTPTRFQGGALRGTDGLKFGSGMRESLKQRGLEIRPFAIRPRPVKGPKRCTFWERPEMTHEGPDLILPLILLVKPNNKLRKLDHVSS